TNPTVSTNDAEVSRLTTMLVQQQRTIELLVKQMSALSHQSFPTNNSELEAKTSDAVGGNTISSGTDGIVTPKRVIGINTTNTNKTSLKREMVTNELPSLEPVTPPVVITGAVSAANALKTTQLSPTLTVLEPAPLPTKFLTWKQRTIGIFAASGFSDYLKYDVNTIGANIHTDNSAIPLPFCVSHVRKQSGMLVGALSLALGTNALSIGRIIKERY